jgi:mannitol/fructose-specific phosphotransferase system IIA component (Ntr-type)
LPAAALEQSRRLFCYAPTSDPRRHLDRLATAVAGMHQAHVVRLARQASLPDNWLTGHVKSVNGTTNENTSAHEGVLCGLVANWPEVSGEAQALLAAAKRVRSPAYILRQAPEQTIRRIVAATAGGVHALRMMALAEVLSQRWNLPVSTLRIEPSPDAASDRSQRGLDALLAHSFILGPTIEVGRVADVVKQIDARTEPEDLLLIGAPHFGVAASHFEGSLPEQVARVRIGPMLMCQSEPLQSTPFRDFLWEANIRLGVQGVGRDEVIRLLVDRLCESGVVPAHLHQACIRQALAREAQGSTVIGCQTALPHALLPDYDGVAAALAVCPAGVAFGPGGEMPKFIILLVSSSRSHDRYLGALARIGQQMIHAGIRRRLLACATPADIMDALAGPEPVGLRP